MAVVTAVTPSTYARWRSTTLGRITEALEVGVVFELAGDLAGRRVLDLGTGDGTYAMAAAQRGAAVTALDSTIGERPPLQAIEALLADPQTTPEALDATLTRWCSEVDGPIREDMAAVRRIRLFTGWFRRGVAFSEKASGYDIRPKAVRPSKQELPGFVALLRGHPGLEMH